MTDKNAKTEASAELGQSDSSAVVMRAELADFFLDDHHGYQETVDLISRLKNPGFGEDVEPSLRKSVFMWATSDPGPKAGYYAGRSKSILMGDA